MKRPSKSYFQFLVVDDEPVILHLVRSILNAGGYQHVACEQTAEAAMAYVARKDVHLVLLDKNLPDGNGIDVLREIKKIRPGTEVILITGYASLDTAIRAIDLGAFSYLIKPFDNVDFFLTRVEAALERAVVRYHGKMLFQRLERVLEELTKTESELDMRSITSQIQEASYRLRVIIGDLKGWMKAIRPRGSASGGQAND